MDVFTNLQYSMHCPKRIANGCKSIASSTYVCNTFPFVTVREMPESTSQLHRNSGKLLGQRLTQSEKVKVVSTIAQRGPSGVKSTRPHIIRNQQNE